MQRITFWLLLLLMATSCHKCGRKIKDIVPHGDDVLEHVTENISLTLEDSSHLALGKDSARFLKLIRGVYEKNNFEPFWFNKKGKLDAADSLITFINNGIFYGLNSQDYLITTITEKSKFYAGNDEMDAVAMAELDISLTEAFFRLAVALHYGRNNFPVEKRIMKEKNEMLSADFKKIFKKGNVSEVLKSYEPSLKDYIALRSALASYIYNNKDSWKTPVVNAGKDTLNGVIKRLQAENFLPAGVTPDSSMIVDAIKCFQERYGAEADGQIGKETFRLMNISFGKRLETIGRNLDRWRELSDTLRENFLLVNIPACELNLVRNDECVFVCRVIVGEVEKQTPLITSSIYNILTYPYWHVPYSIASKEILPKVTEDITYLERQNMEVLDREGNIIDASEIDWTKFNERNLTYSFRQKEGDENSLGIIKFNFKNKHGVYLHDTNAKGLFGSSKRALSHGCVRVEKPLELASELLKNNASVSFDAVRQSIITKERKSINLKTPYPIFIKYFTVGVKNGQILFYPDIYGKD